MLQGHHLELQDYLREQPTGGQSVNIVTEIMKFLNEVISAEMDDSIFSIAIQTFNTLTELCQGPCLENQATLVSLNVPGDVNKVHASALSGRGRRTRAPGSAGPQPEYPPPPCHECLQNFRCDRIFSGPK